MFLSIAEKSPQAWPQSQSRQRDGPPAHRGKKNAAEIEKMLSFMRSSCLAFHSAFIIAIVYQHGGGCVSWRARRNSSSAGNAV
jgi:hypothetical protein